MGRAGITGPVLVVGAGLLGTSIGLALRRDGTEVWLRDRQPEHVRTASGLGAGVPEPEPAEAVGRAPGPALVVVAVPPDLVGEQVADALRRWPAAVVTDVGSVKEEPLRRIGELLGAEAGSALPRYVGSHPMAGSERSGPLAASSALFDGRPWAVVAHEAARPEAVDLVTTLATRCGASVVRMSPTEHDRAVARISHLPHLMSVLVAGRLTGAPADHLALAGQGLRDVTRIAGSDPGLWEQIVTLNADAVVTMLDDLRGDLDRLRAAVAAGRRPDLHAVLARGVAGTRAIPGKHGGPARPTASVFVSVPDHPGELARLFGDAGRSDVNIEDVRIDHDPGRPVGLVELVVAQERADRLLSSLESRGWTTHR